MKIRNGFVSNSSSSSFVAIGFYLKNVGIEEIAKKMFGDNLDFPVEEDNEFYSDDILDYWYNKTDNSNPTFRDEEQFIGYYLVDTGCDEYQLDETSESIENLKAKVEPLREKLGLPADQKVFIVTGTREA